MKKTVKYAVLLFLLGGTAYVFLEKCWRGYSHWSMFLLGGGCFHLIGQVGLRCRRLSLWQRGALCAAAVTAAEFLCGCIVNLWLRLNVWDYRQMPHQLMGQICLPYTLLWGALSIPVMPLYRRLWRRS